MWVYWLTDRTNGEATLIDGDTVERVLGVELGYVEWCIRVDRMFENGKWRVRMQRRLVPRGDFTNDRCADNAAVSPTRPN